jgi:CubicO group peptidase (beta-lactamase class C family)
LVLDPITRTTDLVFAAGDLDKITGWASVTKPIVGTAVLAAIERGDMLLDEPAGPPGATIRHLLSHSSGLAPEKRESLTEPGKRRIYSNVGFEILGEQLGEAIGDTWQTIVTETVTAPLGMQSTSANEQAPAGWGLRGSVRDLLVFTSWLLANTAPGTHEPPEPPEKPPVPSTRADPPGPTHVVSQPYVDLARTVAFGGLAGVVPGVGRYEDCVWGLGFELKGAKNPHWTAPSNSPATFGHFGRSGSFFWVDPAAGVACAAGGGLAFGAWALEVWPAFSEAVLARWAKPRFGGQSVGS